jgi:uncharacterized protein YndB with AHSA1/START domain
MTLSSETTLQITRLFDAPLDRVYAAWTEFGLVSQWWGPDGCQTDELTCEAKRGGAFRWTLTAGNREQMTAHGKFREVRPQEKLVFTWHWADDPDWKDLESLVTVEFIEKDPTTTELRLTHADLPTPQSRDNHSAGWNSALDKLEQLLARLPSAYHSQTPTILEQKLPFN